jgi:hypothetical protein
MSDEQHSIFNEEEEKVLRIGALRILEHQRKSSDDQPGGASGLVLMELLDLNNVHELEKILLWLKNSGFIEIGVRKFVITESGQEFLRKNLS